MLAGYSHLLATAHRLQWDADAISLHDDARRARELAPPAHRTLTDLVSGFCLAEHAVAAELAPRVRVNALDVGGVATRSLDIVLTDDDLRRQFLAGTPMGRPGEPEDIACAALYLASDASSWVTGKVFEIDGGTEAPAMVVPVPPLEPDPTRR